MKKINNILAYCAVFVFLFASCSKDEPSQMGDVPTGDDFAVLTFNSMLNDLADRAMQKAHFDQVPDCSEDEPDYAMITFTVDGVEMDPVEVDILSEDGNYFTAYSEDLKVATPSGGSTMVTLEEFEVYSASDELIWIAPRRTEGAMEDQFAGYVEQSLPFDFEVFAGTKPYIDVEVLCFDRRMANEYGYVFFDIVPKTIYPLCLFANYCNAEGRHWVADYSIDLYYGVDANGEYGDLIQLYDDGQASANATTSVIDGEFQADPLCLVVPGPPANLAAGDPYLTLVVYPMDWDASYGDINNSGVVYELTWEQVNDLLNEDGTTNEYLHIFLGECDEADMGDGSMNPGDGGNTGGNDCVETDPEADCDGDETENKCDPDSIYYDTFDCDNDGILNGDENEGCVNNPDTNCGVDVELATCDLTIGDADNAAGCYRAIIDGQTGDEFTEVTMDTGVPMVDASSTVAIDAATLSISLTDAGIEYSVNAGTQTVSEYLIQVMDAEGNVYCADENDTNMVIEGDFTYPIDVWAAANLCAQAN